MYSENPNFLFNWLNYVHFFVRYKNEAPWIEVSLVWKSDCTKTILKQYRYEESFRTVAFHPDYLASISLRRYPIVTQLSRRQVSVIACLSEVIAVLSFQQTYSYTRSMAKQKHVCEFTFRNKDWIFHSSLHKSNIYKVLKYSPITFETDFFSVWMVVSCYRNRHVCNIKINLMNGNSYYHFLSCVLLLNNDHYWRVKIKNKIWEKSIFWREMILQIHIFYHMAQHIHPHTSPHSHILTFSQKPSSYIIFCLQIAFSIFC